MTKMKALYELKYGIEQFLKP